MLSYRHIYHAGNFADVIKHLILVQVLDHLVGKDKPICYIDTHAGCGSYPLTSGEAQLNREFAGGIGKLWPRTDLPAVVARYVGLVREFNCGDALYRYPGSPWFAQRLLRERDRLLLFERHSTEIERLKRYCAGDRRVKASAEDGFEGAIAMSPPGERRGLILFDPSYEIKSDYKTVAATLVQAHRRFATGVYAIWYPVVDRLRIRQLEKTVKASAIPNIQQFELSIKSDSPNRGMTGSGMLIVNPPWTLSDDMKSALPYLASTLGEIDDSGHNAGSYRIETLVDE